MTIQGNTRRIFGLIFVLCTVSNAFYLFIETSDGQVDFLTERDRGVLDANREMVWYKEFGNDGLPFQNDCISYDDDTHPVTRIRWDPFLNSMETKPAPVTVNENLPLPVQVSNAKQIAGTGQQENGIGQSDSVGNVATTCTANIPEFDLDYYAITLHIYDESKCVGKSLEYSDDVALDFPGTNQFVFKSFKFTMTSLFEASEAPISQEEADIQTFRTIIDSIDFLEIEDGIDFIKAIGDLVIKDMGFTESKIRDNKKALVLLQLLESTLTSEKFLKPLMPVVERISWLARSEWYLLAKAVHEALMCSMFTLLNVQGRRGQAGSDVQWLLDFWEGLFN